MRLQAIIAAVCAVSGVIVHIHATNLANEYIKEVAKNMSHMSHPNFGDMAAHNSSYSSEANIAAILLLSALVFAVWAVVASFLEKRSQHGIIGNVESSIYYGNVDRNVISATSGATVATGRATASQANSYNSKPGPEHYAAARAVVAHISDQAESNFERTSANDLLSRAERMRKEGVTDKVALRPIISEIIEIAKRVEPWTTPIAESIKLLRASFNL
jgi:hypothetical protein